MNNATELTRKQYKICKEIERQLLKEQHNSGNTKYYDIQKELQVELNVMLNDSRMGWDLLTKIQIMHIISMCGSHRPTALHSILIAISKQYDKMISKPSTK